MKPASCSLSIPLTDHAIKRMQQRGISHSQLHQALQYGTCFRAGRGSWAFVFGKKAANQAAIRNGARIAPTNIGVVVRDEVVVTVMHVRSIPHHWQLAGREVAV